MKQYIVFKNNYQDFAIDISKIERIIEFQKPKRIPEASEYFLGVIQYNSQVIPIIDLSMRLYKVDHHDNVNTKIIVVMWQEKLIGLVVDEILGIRSFEEEQHQDSKNEMHILREYVSGFIKEDENITIILDINKTFTGEQEQELVLATEDA